MTATLPMLTPFQCADCEACPIHGKTRPARPVLGRGPTTAELVIVGDAPIGTEVERGKAFSDSYTSFIWSELGRLRLVEEFADLPLSQSRVYVTNVLACPVPEGSAFPQKGAQACRPRLLAELRELNPKVILCLGSQAATAIRGQKSLITHLLGHTEWSEEWQAHLVFAHSPLIVRAEPGAYYDFCWCLRKAAEALTWPDGPRVYPSIDYSVAGVHDSYALKLLRDALSEPIVVCDIETAGLRPGLDAVRSLGFSWSDNFSLIVPWECLEQDEKLWDACDALLSRREGTRVIGHNYQFDVRHLQAWGFDAYVGGDTMLLHYALDERTGRDGGGAHDLKTLARKYCDAPNYAEGIDRHNMHLVPADLMYRYQANDCIYTYRLYHELRHLLNQEPPSRLGYMSPLQMYEQLLVPASGALSRVEQRGILIDMRKVLTLINEYEERIATKRIEVQELLESQGVVFTKTFNPDSHVQVAHVLYDSPENGGLGYPVPPPSKGQKRDARPTNKEALHWLQRDAKRQGHVPNPVFAMLLDYRSLVHTLTTYLKGIAQRVIENSPTDRRLRGHFHLPGTTSGRLSSSDPNLQNIPARSVIKELFIARPGYILINADYRRLEVGVLAKMSQDPQLIADFMAKDFHWTVASKVFPEIVQAMTEAENDFEALNAIASRYSVFNEVAQRQSRATERTERAEELFAWLKELIRRQAKYISFGKMYGEGAESLSKEEKGMGVSIEEAAHYSDIWDQQYPLAIEYLRGLATTARSLRWLETPTGRRRRFYYPRQLERHLTNEAMNFPIQSFASDMCLISLTTLETELPKRNLGFVLGTTHDSILFEVPTDTLEASQELIHLVMTTVVTDPRIVFEIDMKEGHNWGQCH